VLFKISSVSGTHWADWNFNVNTGEHLAYIGDMALHHIKLICDVDRFGWRHAQEVDRNAKDIARAVGLQGLLQGRLLALIASFVVEAVNTKEDFKISLGLLNGLQDHGGLVALRVVEPKSGCDL